MQRLKQLFAPRNMTSGAPWRRILEFAIPMLIGNIAQQLYAATDSVVVGRFMEQGGGEGVRALASVGSSGPVLMFMLALFVGISTGAGILVSQYFGAKDRRMLSITIGNCLTLTAIVSVIIGVLGVLLSPAILRALQTPVAIFEDAVAYLVIYFIGIAGFTYYNVLSGILRGMGDSFSALGFLLLTSALNIALDLLFVIVFKMGVPGVAWATIISQAISCVWVVHFLRGGRTGIRLKRAYMRLDMAVLWPCLALGMSPFIMQASESVLSVVFNASLQRYGGDLAVGAMTICATVMQFAMMPLQGLAQGAQPISSYSDGAGNAQRVKHTVKLLLISSLAYSVLLWGLVQLFPRAFASIFTSDQALASFAADKLRIYTAALFVLGIQIACQMTFISIDSPRNSIIVAVFRKFIVLIPLILILPRLLLADQTQAVFLAEPIADTIAVIFAASLFAREFRKALKGLKPRPLEAA